jgi:diadenosine tetraphosphate (Ap4A) HIT family hydrolase
VKAAERGENPMVMTRMQSGFAVMGDHQFIPGYCVLIASPQADHLSDLPLERRQAFLLDMSLLGEAVAAVCQPRRVNYEILGNAEPFLHAHIWPRYDWEPEDYRHGVVWRYPREQRYGREFLFSEERDGELRRNITAALLGLLAERDFQP